jgi:hypothetical protein
MNIRKSATYCKVLVITAIVMSCVSIECIAQLNIPVESSKMQMAYKNQAYLSFNIKYTYAAETDPNTIIDSSMGTVKMSGNYYWGTMDSLEFMQNNSYNLVLYKSEFLMRIGNPEPVYPQIINFSMFDSLVGKNNYTISNTVNGSVKNLELTFSSPAFLFPYKNYKVSYDSITHFVNQISYTINDEVIDSQESYNKLVSGGPLTEYVIVTANFTNYQTAPFSTTVFNSSNYFLQSGKVFTPQPPYQSYEVFIASPNLLK